MKTCRAELHTHTVLSPCAEVEMIPPLIVQQALSSGITLMAITDHNASANIQAVQQAAAGTDLVVLPGMELQTREEIHSICIFDSLDQIRDFQKWVDGILPNLKNQPDYFGEQFVVDSTGDYICTEPRLLLTSTTVSIDEAWQKVMDLGGILIPAHVDRKSFGLLANLGFVPPHIPFNALELSRHLHPNKALQVFPTLAGYPLIQSGDVHRLNEFLGALFLKINQPTISEIRLALHNQEDRSFSIRNS
ncbi:MAG TPA: PHP domain-containing protein [Anaerolineaceae bacterium]|nr:PHP domain-containing protein [Anaerolineaceae bacterium]